MSFKCAICQDVLENDAISAIKCGHTFHFHCISEWCSRSKTCPTCRYSIKNFDRDIFSNLFFDKIDIGDLSMIVDENDTDSKLVKKLKYKCNLLDSELISAKNELAEKSKEVTRAVKSEGQLVDQLASLRRKFVQNEESASILRKKCSNYDLLVEEKDKLSRKYEINKNKLRSFECFNNIINSSVADAERSINDLKSSSFEDLKPFILGLKKNYTTEHDDHKKTKDKLRLVEKDLKEYKNENESLKKQVRLLKQEVLLMQKRPNQTPFNPELRKTLADTRPDTPAAVSSVTSNSTPMFRKENLTKTKSALSLAVRNSNEMLLGGDEIMRDLNRNDKKMRYDGFGGSIRSCTLFNEKNLIRKSSMKRSASSTNVVSDRKKPARSMKLTDFPMKANVSLDDSVECID